MTRLRRERERRGLSQRELARRAGVAYKTLQLLETGSHDPRASTLGKLASALGLAVPQLLEKEKGGGSLSAAEASARIVREGEASWRLWLFEFVDDFRRQASWGAVAAAPDPRLGHPVHALLASTVEHLCSEKRVPIPWWCEGVPPLPEPWFVAGMENLKAAALAESPAQFRQRNIFVLGNFLSRA